MIARSAAFTGFCGAGRDNWSRSFCAADAKQAFAGAPASALFDSNRYVRHLEAAYLAMAERAAAGLAPDRTEIAPIRAD